MTLSAIGNTLCTAGTSLAHGIVEYGSAGASKVATVAQEVFKAISEFSKREYQEIVKFCKENPRDIKLVAITVGLTVVGLLLANKIYRHFHPQLAPVPA